jgi:hypothetical protein
LLAFISDWLATNHQLSLDAHIAGDIAFGEVLVLPRSSAKTRELRYFGGHRCRHRASAEPMDQR